MVFDAIVCKQQFKVVLTKQQTYCCYNISRKRYSYNGSDILERKKEEHYGAMSGEKLLHVPCIS